MNKKQKIKSYEKVRDQIREKTFANTNIFYCQGCERVHHMDFFVLDHVIKRSQSMYYYDKPENLFPLCSDCNIMREQKGDEYLKCRCKYKVITERLTERYNNLTLEQKKE